MFYLPSEVDFSPLKHLSSRTDVKVVFPAPSEPKTNNFFTDKKRGSVFIFNLLFTFINYY